MTEIRLSASATRSGLRECELLRALAARTWSDIRDGARVDLVVSEESITDYLLLDLRRHSRRLSYLQKWGRWMRADVVGIRRF